MEDPCNVQSEDNKSLPDKNKKRKLKTPTQIEALERFYVDHKYPTEQMKAQLAESIGLMEKQVSGWFCHRRLKDKRSLGGETCDNVRQDRLSGIVIQDHASGHSQDSCGSSKEGDNNNHFDLKEAESKRFIGFGRHKEEEEEETDLDDTSSGDSIPVQKRYLPRDQQQPYMNVENSKYLAMMCSRNIVPADSKQLQVKKTRPSGYLKLKAPVENPAITAVKRQLGRHYLVDGPPLGVEFDSIPPDAFDSPTPDHIMNKSEFIGTNEQFESGMRHGAYNCRTNSQNLDVDGLRSKFILGPDPREYYSSSTISPFPNKSSSEHMHEDYSGEMSPYDDRILTKHSVPRNYARAYKHRTSAETESSFCKSYEQNTEAAQAKHLFTHNMEDRKASRSIDKESNAKYYHSALAVQPQREKKVMTRVQDEPPEYQNTRKAPQVEMPVWTNQLKSDFTRSAIDHVPSSLSDDETATTPSTSSSEED
ncbi:uncharacterized protein LOC124920584 isoform X2 [Impatiens glandulifera]|uniref:uncharacterized protein LOC124920584 isoform X2 n=1 Tax=Impatiens glandulifera TaxID=253017 RepID=UPI001FB15D54|nr:uncharacterized protein LOC124920584 isoform X2 [Impatiens glandulifera]